MCALWNKTDPKDDAKKRSRELVRSTLADILDQRAKIKFAFDKGVTGIKDISGTLISFDASGINVEVSKLKNASESWVGAQVSCYFRVRDKDNPTHAQFLTFVSRISAVRLAANGVVHFSLTLPQDVVNAQQRRSVRVGVDQQRMPMLLVWRELPTGSNISEAPPLLQLETEGQSTFKVDNISSCGLRLIVQNTVMSAALPKQVTGEIFSFYFKAVSEPETPPKTFLVNAALRNIFSDPQKSETSLGFEFVAQGGLDKQKRLVWRPLKANEVSELSAFIFKWNLLDFYQEKRVGGE